MPNLHLLTQTFSQARHASGTDQFNGLEPPLLVHVRAVSAVTRRHLSGYSSRLAIHGYHYLTKCQPLTHESVGYAFRVRRTQTPVWVTLNKTGGGDVVAHARLNIGRGGNAQVVFVLPVG